MKSGLPDSSNTGHYIGLMSGTSLDGVDAVLARFTQQPGQPLRSETIAFVSQPFAPDLRAELFALQTPGADELMRSQLAGNALADAYGAAIAQLRCQHPELAVAAAGAHGQTVRHDPARGVTIQLLNGARLAERCGIDVICDLRSADVAAGGQGAPLVPAFHAGVFAAPDARRAVVNIGGIANVSLLAPGAAPLGYDTGPGNCLLDAWIRRDRSLEYDADGAWGATGTVDDRLLHHLMSDPYFTRPAPKSTHRDYFGLPWLDAALAALGTPLAPADVQATLAEVTARTIAVAVAPFNAQAVYVCGGGARNGDLMKRLGAALAPTEVKTTLALGVDPQTVEALAFAWLAFQRVNRRSGNEPAVTGALGPRVLGAWHAASGQTGG